MSVRPKQAVVFAPSVTATAVTPTAWLSVVIVNFRQWINTARLVAQLTDSECVAARDAEIAVLDNASPDHPISNRLAQMPGVRVTKFTRNTGFSHAVNAGVVTSSGEWILLLNPDTDVPDGFLDQVEQLCRTYDADDPRAGVIGLALKHDDGSPQASSGADPTLWKIVSGMLKPRRIRKGKPLPNHERTPVPWVTGCGLLVRRACWDDLGGFDEDYFLYYEDTDFCRRARRHGWTVWFEPSLTLTHSQPLHTRRVSPELRLITRHALLTYATKHWSRRSAKALAGIVWLEALAKQVVSNLRGRSGLPFQRIRRLAADFLKSNDRQARARVLDTADQLARS
jgi:N-acetylglucosaminyl-diphospho-decaprenol L-rhamnosyltransferase